jgi:hypothetical protein
MQRVQALDDGLDNINMYDLLSHYSHNSSSRSMLTSMLSRLDSTANQSAFIIACYVVGSGMLNDEYIERLTQLADIYNSMRGGKNTKINVIQKESQTYRIL